MQAQQQLSNQEVQIIQQKLQSLLSQYSKLTLIDSTWEKQQEKGTFKNYFKIDSANNLSIARGELEYDFPAQTVLNVLLDNQKLKEWDEYLKETRLIRKFNNDFTFDYFRYKGMLGVDDRDILVATQVYRQGKLTFIVSSSVQDNSCPDVSGVVRAELQFQFYVVEEINPQKCKLIFVSSFDPKGMIPNFIKKQQTKLMAESLLELQKYLNKQNK